MAILDLNKGRVVMRPSVNSPPVSTGSQAPPVPVPGTTFVEEVPAGTVDGTNATFTLSFAPSPASGLSLYKNGIRLTAGLGYVLTGNTIVYQAGYIPQVGGDHFATYRH